MKAELLRQIPKMDLLLETAIVKDKYPEILPTQKKDILTAYLERLREEIKSEKRDSVPALPEIEKELSSLFDDFSVYSLQKVVNGTGIVIHTNLGRAPLSGSMLNHLTDTMNGYSTLEYDAARGLRGSRQTHVEKLLTELTGAEAAMVVNNNAAAVFLVLNTLANQKQVAVSYGELVEIGGSFRVPDIMKLSGAQLCEVGTTNKTRVSDYEKAQTEGAEYFLKVHKSNFKIVGFHEEASLEELAEAGRRTGTKVLYDLGSAFLTDECIPGQLKASAHSAEYCVRKGADIVCFSGDKLLGASQCGIILGCRDMIEPMKKNPYARMFRIDKLSLCVLEENLRLCRDISAAKSSVPVLSMLFAEEEMLKQKAEQTRREIETALQEGGNPAPYQLQICPCTDEPGGGSLPGTELKGFAVSIVSSALSAETIANRLRAYKIPVIARIREDAVLISVRTLMEGDAKIIGEALSI